MDESKEKGQGLDMDKPLPETIQAGEGYLVLRSDIFRALVRLRTSQTATRMALHIVQATFGAGKPWLTASTLELARELGVCSASINNAVSALEKSRVVLVRRKLNCANSYRLNVDCQAWGGVEDA